MSQNPATPSPTGPAPDPVATPQPQPPPRACAGGKPGHRASPSPPRSSATNSWRQATSDLLFFVAGIALSTLGMVKFLIPFKIVPGGLTGIGTVLYYTAGVPIGLFVIAGNIGLIAMQARVMGLGSSSRTVVAILVQNIVLDLAMRWYHVPAGESGLDPMLGCLYGGVFGGLGAACIFRSGATLGGTDILAQLLLRLRGIPIGTTLYLSDALVTVVAGSAFGLPVALYTLIKVYVSGRVIDSFLEGFAVKRLVLIVSGQAEAIGWGIIEELHRGATLLNARGMYTGKATEVLLTAIRREQMPFLERLVYEIDPAAFIIVSDARRILGKGFEDLEAVVAGQ